MPMAMGATYWHILMHKARLTVSKGVHVALETSKDFPMARADGFIETDFRSSICNHTFL